MPNYPDPRGFPQLKPQVVAPGVAIRSSVIGLASDYELLTGTSMSAPHVTGLVALMLDAGECLHGDYATLGTLIMQTARPVPHESGGTPPPGVGNVPNYATGWGEIDAAAAVEAAAAACGPQGFISGRLTSAFGAPIAAAKVEIFVDESVRVYQTITEPDGRFIRRLPEQLTDGYTVRISAWGFLPSSEIGIRVSNGVTTRQDVQLQIATAYKVTGRIIDGATGWPLHAHVRITYYPGAPVWSDPVTGVYSVRLPEGRRLRFDVTSDIPGYAAATRELLSVNSGIDQDFALGADLVACTAPGYRSSSLLFDEGFDGATGIPPGGWSLSSAGLGWLFGTAAELTAKAAQIPEHGRIAAANDELGEGNGINKDGRNDLLNLPPINLSGSVNPVLRFSSFLPAFTNFPITSVEGSADGGTIWIALGVPQRDFNLGEWTSQAIDLTSIAVPGARVRFHSNDGTTEARASFGFLWAIDDVAIRALQRTGQCKPRRRLCA